jgi:5-(carboxyamino)imidazole ribonucleotide synthase
MTQDTKQAVLLPGATIGMIGGGQLGRMFTVAARTMGYQVIVLEPQENSPAGQLADQQIVAAYDDADALLELGKACDVITTEFENIPAHVLERLAKDCPVRPSANALGKTQDRSIEKAFIKSCGLLPVPYGVIESESDIETAVKAVSFPAILKTARLGYDGKGQVVVNAIDDVQAAFASVGKVACVLEQRVDLDKEISVVLGRNENGETQCFPVGENIHKNGILHQNIVPARVDEAMAVSAKAAAKRLAEKLEFVGVMAVEFFITKQGDLFVNEMAPRTHNSGHYTQDACVTSQFEQQVRMVCNLPFGDSRLLSPVVMTNLLGDVWGDEAVSLSQPNWEQLLKYDNCKLHLYGKEDARIGRKMGHFNVLDNDIEQAIERSDRIMQSLEHLL